MDNFWRCIRVTLVLRLWIEIDTEERLSRNSENLKFCNAFIIKQGRKERERSKDLKREISKGMDEEGGRRCGRKTNRREIDRRLALEIARPVFRVPVY